MVPSNLALTYIKPRWFFPGMMIVWAGLTMCTAAAHKPEHIMAIRFFQGIAESSTFIGTHYILGAWYTETELGKRSGIFTASGLAGTLFGGFLQTAIHKSMNGLHGMSGWRWLFIIDGIITIPVAIYGFLLFPDTPGTTQAPYLNEQERALAVARVPRIEHGGAKITMRLCKQIFTSWKYYGFVMLWVIAGETESFSTNALMALWMKAQNTKTTTVYSVAQLNNYPSGVPAVGIVATIFWATLTDFLGGKRYLVGFFIGIVGTFTAIMVLAKPESEAVIFAAYYVAGSVYACQATFFAWANDACRYEDHVFRSIVIASMNMFSGAVNAWWSIVFYGAKYAPKFTRGAWAMIAVCIAMAIWTAGLLWFCVREEKSRNLEALVEEREMNKEQVLAGNLDIVNQDVGVKRMTSAHGSEGTEEVAEVHEKV
jgi:ACS family pantothenate transporter-like MFS transporter